jgi:acyl carrier protein
MNPEQQRTICEAIAERFGLPLERVVPEATMESLNIDSLSMIEFMFEVEEKLGISLSESREPLKTLADVFAEIDKALQSSGKSAQLP